MAVGKATVIPGRSKWIEWPTSWAAPMPSGAGEAYANEVEVDEGQHDAVLRFYRRRRGESRKLVAEITVPLSVLADFRKPAPKGKAK